MGNESLDVLSPDLNEKKVHPLGTMNVFTSVDWAHSSVSTLFYPPALKTSGLTPGPGWAACPVLGGSTGTGEGC